MFPEGTRLSEWWQSRSSNDSVAGGGLSPTSPAVLLQLDRHDEEQAFIDALTRYRWAVVVCKPFDDLVFLALRWQADIAIVGELGVMQLESSKTQVQLISISDEEDEARRILAIGADFVMIRPILESDPMATPGVCPRS